MNVLHFLLNIKNTQSCRHVNDKANLQLTNFLHITGNSQNQHFTNFMAITVPWTRKLFITTCYLKQFTPSLTCIPCISWERVDKWYVKILPVGLGNFWSSLQRLLMSHNVMFFVFYSLLSQLFNTSNSKILKQRFRGAIFCLEMVHYFKKERRLFIYDYYYYWQ